MIQLSENCPIFKTDAEHHLHRFLYTVFQQWHILAAPSPERLRAMLPASIWNTYGEYLMQAYKRSINTASMVYHSDCATCVPHKVADYYSLPVLVIVEDDESDGGWLFLVATRLQRRVADRPRP
jgi:hypothetical protein